MLIISLALKKIIYYKPIQKKKKNNKRIKIQYQLCSKV